MGAWGVGHFENDSALDWLGEFLESEDKIKTLKETFEAANGNKGFFSRLFSRSFEIEEPEASAVLVAGEIVSLLLGKPAEDLPEELINWVGSHQLKVDKNLVSAARNAISAVKNKSELKLLWEETEDYQNWLEEVKNLENRLK